MIAIDLSKQKVLDTNPKTIQQVKFTGNLAWKGNFASVMFFIIVELK